MKLSVDTEVIQRMEKEKEKEKSNLNWLNLNLKWLEKK